MARNEILITHAGETMNVSQWAKRIGISAPALGYRLNTGWPLEQALSPSCRGRDRSTGDHGAMIQRKRVLREFNVLVRSVDQALTTFRAKLDQLFPIDDDTPGAVAQPAESAKDRLPRVAEKYA
mgnify:CR=1 FL=1